MRLRHLFLALGTSSLLVLSTAGLVEATSPAPVTRAAFVADLARALNVTPERSAAQTFRDLRPGTADYGFVEAAAHLGWVKGAAGHRFLPTTALSREAMAKILVLAVGLGPKAIQMSGATPHFPDAASIAPWARADVAVAQSAGLLKGLPNGLFDPSAFVTPSQAHWAIFHALHYLASQPGNIMQLQTTSVVASTVDATNGDRNPYGMAYDGYAGTSSAPNPYFGDLLVGNFSNKSGTMGLGTTVEAVNPSTGAVTRFTGTASGPAALAVSPKGPLWIANFGSSGANGNVEVTTPTGGLFPSGGSTITSSSLDGPWGQAFVPGQTPAFLVTGALNGTIDAMYGFVPPAFNTATKFIQIGSDLATNHNPTDPQGPQGMVYDAATGKIYVTDTADSSIRAYTWSGPATADQGTGTLIMKGGALRRPVGIALDPVNGNLLVVNQGDNNLVEIALSGHTATVVGQRVLDHAAVNPTTGAGSALFGIVATDGPSHTLDVYYTDDRTNTVNVLR